MTMYSYIGFMTIILIAIIFASSYAILKRLEEIDKKTDVKR